MFTTDAAWAAPSAAAYWAGRWEGEVAIPGAPLALIIDLADQPQPTGSIILPGRGVKGAALRQVAVQADGRLQLLLPAVLGDEARAKLRVRSDGRLVGEFEQAGHRAAVTLQRSGPAQVDAAPASTAVPTSLLGTWVGGYELGGQPRQVTLTLIQPGTVAQATLVIHGRRRSELPIEQVAMSGAWLLLVSPATGVTLEGRVHAADGSLRGLFRQGPLEAEFVLKKQAASP